MATHSSTLAWKIPWMEEPGRLQSMGSPRVGHDWATSLSLFTFMHWRRKWQLTPVFLPGESQGQGKPGGLLSMESHRVGHDWSNFSSISSSKKGLGAYTTVPVCHDQSIRVNHFLLGLFKIYLFIWVHQVLVGACRIFYLQHVNSYLQHVGSSFLTRDWTQAPCIGSAVINHWTTREVPGPFVERNLGWDHEVGVAIVLSLEAGGWSLAPALPLIVWLWTRDLAS